MQAQRLDDAAGRLNGGHGPRMGIPPRDLPPGAYPAHPSPVPRDLSEVLPSFEETAGGPVEVEDDGQDTGQGIPEVMPPQNGEFLRIESNRGLMGIRPGDVSMVRPTVEGGPDARQCRVLMIGGFEVEVPYSVAGFLAMVAAFRDDDSGATAIEYGLIVGLVSIAAVGAFSALGTEINDLFGTVTTTMNAVSNPLP